MSAVTEAAVRGRKPAPRTRRGLRLAISQGQFLTVLSGVFVFLMLLMVVQDGASTAGNEVWRGLVLGAIYALIAVLLWPADRDLSAPFVAARAVCATK